MQPNCHSTHSHFKHGRHESFYYLAPFSSRLTGEFDKFMWQMVLDTNMHSLCPRNYNYWCTLMTSDGVWWQCSAVMKFAVCLRPLQWDCLFPLPTHPMPEFSAWNIIIMMHYLWRSSLFPHGTKSAVRECTWAQASSTVVVAGSCCRGKLSATPKQ